MKHTLLGDTASISFWEIKDEELLKGPSRKRDQETVTNEENVDDWKIGDNCTAQWNEDLCWYKANIIDIKQDGIVRVNFFEYGTLADARLNTLKPFDTKVGDNGQLIDDNLAAKVPPNSIDLVEANVSSLEFNIGEACIAQWTEDKVWYNGVVEKIECDSYKVKFTDYGNVDNVKLMTETVHIPGNGNTCYWF